MAIASWIFDKVILVVLLCREELPQWLGLYAKASRSMRFFTACALYAEHAQDIGLELPIFRRPKGGSLVLRSGVVSLLIGQGGIYDAKKCVQQGI